MGLRKKEDPCIFNGNTHYACIFSGIVPKCFLTDIWQDILCNPVFLREISTTSSKNWSCLFKTCFHHSVSIEVGCTSENENCEIRVYFKWLHLHERKTKQVIHGRSGILAKQIAGTKKTGKSIIPIYL